MLIKTQLIVDVNRFVSISFLGNLTGCLLFAALTSTAFGYGSIATFAISIAVAKTSAPWFVLFWKGIFANWLVNLAIIMSSSTSNNLAKLFSLWIPITTFVTIGFEHSVANMFLIPFGILSGAPVLWSHFFFGNLLPVTIGNFIGASVLVAFCHWKALMENDIMSK